MTRLRCSAERSVRRVGSSRERRPSRSTPSRRHDLRPEGGATTVRSGFEPTRFPEQSRTALCRVHIDGHRDGRLVARLPCFGPPELVGGGEHVQESADGVRHVARGRRRTTDGLGRRGEGTATADGGAAEPPSGGGVSVVRNRERIRRTPVRRFRKHSLGNYHRFLEPVIGRSTPRVDGTKTAIQREALTRSNREASSRAKSSPRVTTAPGPPRAAKLSPTIHDAIFYLYLCHTSRDYEPIDTNNSRSRSPIEQYNIPYPVIWV